MSDLIQVDHLSSHMRGERCRPPSGRVYEVSRETGFLHLCDGDTVAEEPGVHPDDAAHYSTPTLKRYRVHSSPSSPVPSPVKSEPDPPVEVEEEEVEEEVEEDVEEDVEEEVEEDENHYLEILDQNIRLLTQDLETGDYDDYLGELLEAEEAGKTRSSAVRALKARIRFNDDQD